MRDRLVSLLRQNGSPRTIDTSILKQVRTFFLDRVNSTLGSARRHPLGFLVIAEKIDSSLTLRYHVWPPGWSVPSDQIGSELHDHTYELNSLVIAGSIRQRTYRVTLDNSGNHNVFEVAYSDGSSTLVSTGQRARLETETDEVFVSGIAYRLLPGIPHYVEAIKRPCATIVLTVQSERPAAPTVFIPLDASAPGQFLRGLLNENEMEAVRTTLTQI